MDRHAPLACLNTQMKRLIPSFAPATVALCAVAALSGCVAYPYGGQPGQGVRLKPGMVFTIEPMINAGRAGTSVMRDGWTVVTKDRSLSAQWEHIRAVNFFAIMLRLSFRYGVR